MADLHAENLVESCARANIVPATAGSRPMVRTSLMGRHTHVMRDGSELHVWARQGKYLIRGSYQGKRFGKTVGPDPVQAESQLREILCQIENSTFVPPREARKHVVKTGMPPQISVRELVDRKLYETRQVRGRQTARDYRARFEPLIGFAEDRKNRVRYRVAAAIDRAFATEFAAHLRTLTVTRNGHPIAERNPISGRQIHNILSTTSMLLDWARRSDVNLLPSTFTNPFTRELVGERPLKDLLEKPLLTIDIRIDLVAAMDAWQLCTFSWSMLLPQRPEEFGGLLIGDVNPATRELIFATRLGGDDFNKAHASFRCVFPPALDPIVLHSMSDRRAGPLLLRRTAIDGRRPPKLLCTNQDEITDHFNKALLKAPAGEITCANDRKRIFRGVLRVMGGIDEDAVARDFQALLLRVHPEIKATFYSLRGAVLSDMADAGVDYLTRQYVAGRSLRRETNAIYEYHDLSTQLDKHFKHVNPLVTAITERAAAIGMQLDNGSIDL